MRPVCAWQGLLTSFAEGSLDWYRAIVVIILTVAGFGLAWLAARPVVLVLTL
jgi:hypothetical protein